MGVGVALGDVDVEGLGSGEDAGAEGTGEAAAGPVRVEAEDVLAEVAALGEAGPAELAGEGALARVRRLVQGHRPPLAEPLPAHLITAIPHPINQPRQEKRGMWQHLASEGLLPRVNPLVADELGRFAEGLPAVWAEFLPLLSFVASSSLSTPGYETQFSLD